VQDDTPTEDFALGVPGFRFSDLYEPLRLRDLHRTFWQHAEQSTPGLQARFERHAAGELSPPDQSDLLIEVAAILSGFIAKLFHVEDEAGVIRRATVGTQPVFRFKQDFLRTRVFKDFGKPPCTDAEFDRLDAQVNQLLATMPSRSDAELQFAETTLALFDAEKEAASESPREELVGDARRICAGRPEGTLAERIAGALQVLGQWCVQVNATHARRKRVRHWLSFVRPGKLEFDQLVPLERPRPDLTEAIQGPSEHQRRRDGFGLTDSRMTPAEYLREVDYCIICHPRQKDSCSHGFREATGVYKKNPLGIPLAGCPLDERISEMHELRKSGEVIGPLALVMLDNPMCPGTGHRVCNDCMKGCIFQKQDPVNIPQIETGILTEVLNLPYGFEIYSLLTRFNPLNHKRPYALPYNGADVLVVGLGPAGYTLSHYLANDGFGVVGIDALKLEPLPEDLTGFGRALPRPLRDFGELKSRLDERILLGFGGVSEYGITVRWDKTFLAVMYLTLLRRKNVRLYGGVRFGGTLEIDDAWNLGFRHVAIAAGAGKPTVVPTKNNLVRGVRTASDFLMALQLTGAFKRSSLANLQVRLPAIVIGGGLTAIDTATELLAYYPVQVEKALDQFEKLSASLGEDAVWRMCDPEETLILKEFLEHGRAIRAERDAARAEARDPDFVSLCRAWGGVSIAYRRRIQDSPAYRLNHEEIIKALEEGITFIENVSPTAAVADQFGAIEKMHFLTVDGRELNLPARSVCMAAGTVPNTVCEREKPGHFLLDSKGQFFQKHRTVRDEQSGDWTLEPVNGPSNEAFFLSYEKEGRFVSFYGDNHPDFAGNVVKAMASSKHGAPHVARLFEAEIARCEESPTPREKFRSLVQKLDEALLATIVEVRRLTPTIVEIVVRARQAARKFKPGQFYRFQNYETQAPIVDGVRLTLEGLALTGAWVEPENDLIGLIALEMGVSSRLCAALKPGDPVVLMGPTGEPSETPAGETVLLAGGGLGNAVLFSIGKALKAHGSRVLYFAGYRRKSDVFLMERIEEATDQVIWAVDAGEPIHPRRPHDLSFVGNIVQAMLGYARGELGEALVSLKDVDRIIAIGSDRMMAAVADARRNVLKEYLKSDHAAIASINSMMQCMMKEVCGQCLQGHLDPSTGHETGPVFSCFNQDQAMDCVDFANLRNRLKTNSVAEKLSNRRLDMLLEAGDVERI
jgi:NADPH-dependent glutamate synthase beta subunit-like oxidoreductase/NAD(P)H-flavin reductase